MSRSFIAPSPDAWADATAPLGSIKIAPGVPRDPYDFATSPRSSTRTSVISYFVALARARIPAAPLLKTATVNVSANSRCQRASSGAIRTHGPHDGEKKTSSTRLPRASRSESGPCRPRAGAARIAARRFRPGAPPAAARPTSASGGAPVMSVRSPTSEDREGDGDRDDRDAREHDPGAVEIADRVDHAAPGVGAGAERDDPRGSSEEHVSRERGRSDRSGMQLSEAVAVRAPSLCEVDRDPDHERGKQRRSRRSLRLLRRCRGRAPPAIAISASGRAKAIGPTSEPGRPNPSTAPPCSLTVEELRDPGHGEHRREHDARNDREAIHRDANPTGPEASVGRAARRPLPDLPHPAAWYPPTP